MLDSVVRNCAVAKFGPSNEADDITTLERLVVVE
jgi:hypothetical protein